MSETSNTPNPLLGKLEHNHFLQYWKSELQLLQLKTAEAFSGKKNTTPQNCVSVEKQKSINTSLPLNLSAHIVKFALRN